MVCIGNMVLHFSTCTHILYGLGLLCTGSGLLLSFCAGSGLLSSGSGLLSSGSGPLSSGSGLLCSGSGLLSSGSGLLCSGSGLLSSGSAELPSGSDSGSGSAWESACDVFSASAHSVLIYRLLRVYCKRR